MLVQLLADKAVFEGIKENAYEDGACSASEPKHVGTTQTQTEQQRRL